MGIPSTDEMIMPVLRFIVDGQEYRRLNIINMLTEHFSLTENERRVLSYTGLMERYLSSVEFIERPRERYYQITDRGLEFLNQNSLGKMGIPSTDEIIVPVLQYIANGQEYQRINIINMLTEHFSLTESERRVLSYTGLMERYLSSVEFIERTSIGYYRITDRGLGFLDQNS